MIINSNLPHSQALKSELDSRVSFDVYQDTEERNVWGLMQGGKDDIYIYDRCGRLAHYIPFPHSIMEEEGSSLVGMAIIATSIAGSRCGERCDQIDESNYEEFLSGNMDVPETTTDVTFGTSDYHTFTASNMLEEILRNETALTENDHFFKTAENGSDLYSSEDLDYSVSNDTAYEENNETQAMQHTYNDLLRVLLKNETLEEVEESNNISSSTNDSLSTLDSRNTSNDNPMLIDSHHSHREPNDTEIRKIKPQTLFSKRKFDRCAEADLSICKNWSKRRLLRAQTCCSTDHASTRILDYCKNYGKKRCKKIRTILKCCIKTEYVETTTTELPTVANTTTVGNATELDQYEINCCRNGSMGKMCRVSVTGSCESDEFIEEKVETTDTLQTDNLN